MNEGFTELKWQRFSHQYIYLATVISVFQIWWSETISTRCAWLGKEKRMSETDDDNSTTFWGILPGQLDFSAIVTVVISFIRVLKAQFVHFGNPILYAHCDSGR
jgi:hypothetical protein